MATDLETGTWEARDTTVDVVERQMARLLQDLNHPLAPTDGASDLAHPPPRTSVLNLLVRAEDAAEADRAGQLVAELAVHAPSRTLQLLAVPDAAADGLDATICTQCAVRSDGRSHICFEHVSLVARGNTALHLASVAEPLIVANLPVILWWLGRPPLKHDPLLDLCDRLVVDSDAFADPPAGLAALDARAAATEGGLALGDLGWHRGRGWRQLIAQFFDPLDARPYQQKVRRLTVDYAATPGRTLGAAPLLLVGWLASRLGWGLEQVSDAGGALDGTFTLGPADDASAPTEIAVRVRPRPVPAAEPGELLAVTLSARRAGAADGDPTTFEVRRDEASACATTRAALAGVREVSRRVALDRPATAELLVRELQATVADPVYAESLAMVARLVR
jgi:glucose-6-phosphate dehydrogenase assembly protein OpcA